MSDKERIRYGFGTWEDELEKSRKELQEAEKLVTRYENCAIKKYQKEDAAVLRKLVNEAEQIMSKALKTKKKEDIRDATLRPWNLLNIIKRDLAILEKENKGKCPA